jgi:hypothetical protein
LDCLQVDLISGGVGEWAGQRRAIRLERWLVRDVRVVGKVVEIRGVESRPIECGDRAGPTSLTRNVEAAGGIVERLARTIHLYGAATERGVRAGCHEVGNEIRRHAAGIVDRVDDVGLCLDLGRDRHVGERRLRCVRGLIQRAEREGRAQQGDECSPAEMAYVCMVVHVGLLGTAFSFVSASPARTSLCPEMTRNGDTGA